MDVKPFLSLLVGAGKVIEVRVPKYGTYRNTASGYFDDLDAAAAAVTQWDGKANIYVTLNPVHPALLARANNRIVERADSTTADADISERRWLFIDVDPTRPSGISSTDDELQAAERVATSIASHCRSLGWPDPIEALSGNGRYLLYPIELPNDPDATSLVRRVVESIAARFDGADAHVDQSVFNASRIVALLGTTKVKGDPLPDRPHRRSQLLRVPDSIRPVTREQLEQMATWQTEPRSKLLVQTGGSVADKLREHSIEYREQAPDANGVTWYHVQQCPFHDDGRPFECGVGQKLPDGAYAGHCFHPEGQGKTWHDWKIALGLAPTYTSHDQVIALGADRPRIVVSGRHRRDIVDDAWNALLGANDPVRFFRHGNDVVEIAKAESGSAVIKHLGYVGLSGRLDRCADFVRLTQSGEQPARPPRDVIEDMQALEIPLPALRGIIATPGFSVDGVLETKAGYQSSTGLYYEPVGQPVQDVPREPDVTDLRIARLRLGDDLFGDFPWADERASLANVIAALITPMVRDLVPGPAPLFALDAPKAGNGKGLLANCVSIVTTGYEASVMADTKSEEEFRKRVTTKLMEGSSVVLLDNVRRRLDSGSFAALLTATIWTDRVLGLSRTVTLPVRSLFLVTGNNLQFSDEITRRTVSVRIDAKSDRPWEGRAYRHPDLIGWLKRHRHDVIWACLVLVQHWIARGRPEWTGQPMGSYESWCRTLGGILECAGIQGFLENRPELYRRGDADSEEWRAFTSGWLEQYGTIPVKVGDLQAIAEETLTSLFESLKDGASDKTIRTKLGKALATRRDNRFADLFIRQAGSDGHTKTAQWFVERAGSPSRDAGDDEGESRRTPASPPHKNQPISDSDAVDAGNAGIDSAAGKLSETSGSPIDAYAETGNATPQYPHHPQLDSTIVLNEAGDPRVIDKNGARYPQCKRCARVPEKPGSNLCDACRADALANLIEGQR